jgi:transcriptional regulator with XRE-family HTH domain
VTELSGSQAVLLAEDQIPSVGMSAENSTTPDPPDPASEETQLSQRLRTLRHEKGMPLREMAQIAGVSVSFLSQVERGTASPSIGTLIRMARALDETVSSLFEPRNHARLIRADARPTLVHPERQWSEELLSPRDFTRLQFIRSTLAPGGSTGPDALSYDVAETCMLVESGRLTVWLEEEEMELGPGDCLAYDPHQSHRFHNQSDAPVVLIFASSPPSY